MSSVFQDWHISTEVFGATVDNGQNIVNAIKSIHLEHFPSLVNARQLAIKKACTVSRV